MTDAQFLSRSWLQLGDYVAIIGGDLINIEEGNETGQDSSRTNNYNYHTLLTSADFYIIKG